MCVCVNSHDIAIRDSIYYTLIRLFTHFYPVFDLLIIRREFIRVHSHKFLKSHKIYVNYIARVRGQDFFFHALLSTDLKHLCALMRRVSYLAYNYKCKCRCQNCGERLLRTYHKSEYLCFLECRDK